jgi:hypothetical protein
MEAMCEVFDGNLFPTVKSVSCAESDPAEWRNDVPQRRALDPLVFIGHEMKLVPQVERVFVSREDETGRVLRVTVVVDSRDAEVRASIYKREQAVMDEMKNFEFDFHIIAREGRPLASLITDAGAGDETL